jgi:putative endonuclease
LRRRWQAVDAAVLKTVDQNWGLESSLHSAGKFYRHFFMPFFTYILYSQQYNKHYYGSCSNLEVRLKNHNAGKVRSTKAYRPYEVKYFEQYETKKSDDARVKPLILTRINNHMKNQTVIFLGQTIAVPYVPGKVLCFQLQTKLCI